MTFSNASYYDVHDPDVVILTSETDNPTEFYLHSTVLASASPFFGDMFTLPQSSLHSDGLPVIPVSESSRVMEILLNLVYGPDDPVDVDTMEELSSALGAAIKYDFTHAILILRTLLKTPRFLHKHAIHVYAIASMHELEDEMEAAAKETFKLNLLEGPPNDDLRYISAFDYHHLLHLHHRRAIAAAKLFKCPDGVTCMQCNNSVSNMHDPPMWWKMFEAMARDEMDERPATDIIFGSKFLFQAVERSGCSGCSESIVHSWEVLMQLKKKIDELPLS
ncbi:hypothetical protein BJ165DRAFT_1335775 [Panaeolus papilionaceus]|nr:hypothetical protein BJ165DRAFT_1335775 [Panaeolus papilionaceus]